MELRRLPPVPLPGPRPIPVLGPAGSLLRFFRDPIRCLRDVHRRYGNLASVSAGDASMVCAFGPEYNHQVLSDPDLFFSAAELPIRIPPGSSLERLTRFLVGMNGEEHQRLRRLMMPLFQKTYLDNYRADMIAAAEEQLSSWRAGRTIDLAAAMDELALRNSFRCLFGMDISGDARWFADMGLRFAEGGMSPVLIALPFDLPHTPYGNFMKLCEELEERLKDVIRRRRSTVEGGRDTLSLLIAARDGEGAGLSDARLIGLANELFIAGHKSTAATLTWTLFLLERHPRVYDDVLDELSSVLHGDAPTVEQLDRLVLLDAVVKESMRLLPGIAFLFFRRLTRPARVGPYELPTGAALILSPLITHHMAELYPEPDRFRPERWSSARPSPYGYMPFGAGPRTCLGAAFASLSVRMLLAIVLQRFRLSLVPNSDVSYRARSPILGTRDGLPMRVQPRDHRVREPPKLRGNIRGLVELD